MSKTIVEKLNLKKYQRTAVLYTPEGEHSLDELHDADHELTNEPYDMIFAYVLDMKSLQELVHKVIEQSSLKAGGYLFAAYPKKGNKVYATYIHRDELLEGLGAGEDGYIGTSHLKFSRMVGMNDVFTVVGLKHEAKKAAKASAAAKPSQRVDDYTGFIRNIEEDLSDAPNELAFYQSLKPGYRKSWARYVYSTVQEETRAKRRKEMIAILSQGYKSMDLYRQR
ncbi:YdeI/OmpD-associated family protein [Paenibacillus camelliae]|uniref:YdeI/OmpD-associated family protein n=1 Tax=Paenibacillus camelliae TaxID=512410 RepID=UPI00203B15BA|nr:YdeI/OmpD-associated family protein [Paenibacillus camelliae]MCM3633408.1 YdeI/OmpD-associated family protein [Paenibacillus camelliae]